MKKMLLTFLLSGTFVYMLPGQTLVQQIEEAYSSIDTCSYLDNLLASCKGYYTIWSNGAHEWTDLAIIEDQLDSLPRQGKVIDSLWVTLSPYSKTFVEGKMGKIKSIARDHAPTFLLNLLLQADNTLQEDTGKLPFNLFYFDEKCKGDLYVFCEDGEYSCHDSYYRTFSRCLGRNAPKVFRRIMKKQPDYWLYCYALEWMNTILYMKDRRIYVYRICEMKEYELDEYLTKFKNSLPRPVVTGF